MWFDFKMAAPLGKNFIVTLVFLAAASINGQSPQDQLVSLENSSNIDATKFDTPDFPNERFSPSFYKRAQNYTATHWKKMTAGDVDDFSQYSQHLETRLRNKMAEIAGVENNPELTIEDMTKLFATKSDNGEITSAEVST